MANENDKPSEGSSTSDSTTAATAGAEQILKRGRGRPKGGSAGASGSTGNASTDSTELAARKAELQAQFDRLYAPEVWEGIVAAPANVALAITGNKIWDLPDKEVKVLSVQAAVTARCFAVSDPKWLALTMLFVSLATTYGARAAEYYSEKAIAKASKTNTPPGDK